MSLLLIFHREHNFTHGCFHMLRGLCFHNNASCIFFVVGEKKVVTLDELEYIDSSSDDFILYQLASVPQFGQLMYDDQVLSLGDGFAHSDISSRHIR